MKCNEIKELLSLYIDRMLDESQLKEIEEHLSVCDGCRKEYIEMKEMLDLLGQAEMIPVPDAFCFRLRKALKEEKQNMIDSGIICKPSKNKNRWRIITSIAAVFAVGVITLSLYSDVLGILPDKLNGGDQAGAVKQKEDYDEYAGKNEGIAESPADPNLSSDGSVMMKNQESDPQTLATESDLAAAGGSDTYIYDSSETNSSDNLSNDLNKESSPEDQMITYGLADDSKPDTGEESDMAADTAEPEAAAGADGLDRSLVNNSKLAPYQGEGSRSLAVSGVERNTAAVQFYNNLIEEKLKGFDYQVLESSYTQTGEWQFRIFIFRGKDGNTYNEEILIVGKDGEIKVICSNEFMGL